MTVSVWWVPLAFLAGAFAASGMIWYLAKRGLKKFESEPPVLDDEAKKFYEELVNAKPTDVQVGSGPPVMRDGSLRVEESPYLTQKKRWSPW